VLAADKEEEDHDGQLQTRIGRDERESEREKNRSYDDDEEDNEMMKKGGCVCIKAERTIRMKRKRSLRMRQV
jgi:hypothetical protein